jgi:hypothetical protein
LYFGYAIGEIMICRLSVTSRLYSFLNGARRWLNIRALLLGMMVFSVGAAQAITLAVTNNADSGVGSLRAALITIQGDTPCANAPYIINFNIASAPYKITLSSALPAITCQTAINGYSQTGASPNTALANSSGSNAVILIELNGTGCTGCSYGLSFVGGAINSVISGLAITGFRNTGAVGINVGANAVQLNGNFFGLAANGLIDDWNKVSVYAGTGVQNLAIGSASAAGRNLFAGAILSTDAVWLQGANNTLIRDNRFGFAKNNSLFFGLGTRAIFVDGATNTSISVINRIDCAGIGKGIVVSPLSGANVENTGVKRCTIGIDLGNDGDTANVVNGARNHPIITGVLYTGVASTEITATFNAQASSSYYWDYYTTTTYDVTKQGEAGIGSDIVGTNASNLAVSSMIGTVSPVGTVKRTFSGAISNPSITATNQVGNVTSEYSPMFPTATVVTASNPQTLLPGNVGGFSDTIATFTNDSTSPTPWTISAINFVGPEATEYSSPANTCNNVAAGASCTVTIRYTPTVIGSYTANSMVITSNAPVPPVNLSATAAATSVLASPTSFAFGSVNYGQQSISQTFTLTNLSGVTATSANTSYAGIGDDFIVVSETCSLGTANGQMCNVVARFAPLTAPQVPKSATLQFFIGASSASISLSGTPTSPTGAYLASTSGSPTSITVFSNLRSVGTVNSTGFGIINLGLTAATISGVSGTAPFSGDVGTCGVTLAAGASCAPNAIFTPASVGSFTNTINVVSNAINSPLVINVNANSTATLMPTISLNASPTSVILTSGVSTVTVQINNPNTAPLTSPSFTVNLSTSGANVVVASAPNAANSCAGPLTFAPIANASLVTVSGMFLGGSATCTLTFDVIRNGTAGAGTVSVNNFFSTQVAGSIAASVTITATGGVAPVITSAPALPAGTVGSAYSTTLTATGTPTITWSLQSGSLPAGLGFSAAGVLSGIPTAAGTFGFTIQAANATAPNASQTVSITIAAAGTLPVITSPAPPSGFTNANYSFTPSATGTAPITWSIVGNLPPGLNIAPSTGAITGIPSAAGTFVFTLRATNTAGQANQATAITITVPIIPEINVAPASLSFGNQNIGTVSPAQTVTVSNRGNGDFNINSITGIGDFGFVSACPGTLAAGANCTISFTFSPLTAGALTGLTSVNTTALRGAGSINLDGIGISVPRPNIVITIPGSLSFGDQAVGTSSAAQIVFISNTGLATLELRSLAVNGTSGGTGFIQTTPPAADNPRNHPGCGGTLAPGASCALGLSFSPSATGNQSASLDITHNSTPTGAAGSSSIPMTGNGTPRREAIIRLSGAGSLNFADQVLGTTSAAQTLTVTNAGTINLNVGSISVTPTNANTVASEFQAQAASGCGTLTPNSNCSINVSFSPSGVIGSKAATINIASNAVNAATATINASGNAIPIPAPIVRLSATSIGFGNIIRGGAASSQRITITNIGGLPLNISGISSTSSDFRVTNSCTTPLMLNQSCTADITFSPLALGRRSGTLTITSNATPATNTVTLSGTGCRYLSPAAQRIIVSACG